MKITAVKMDNYSQNKNNTNTNFRASLPKIGAIPVQADGWDRVYLTCKKQGKLNSLKNTIIKLKDAGTGVLGCVWRGQDQYPTFYSAKNSEELTKKVNPILDFYNKKDTVSSVSLVSRSNKIVAVTFDVRMHSEVESQVIDANGVGDAKKECDSILKTLDDIATQGTTKNDVLFGEDASNFFKYLRE